MKRVGRQTAGRVMVTLALVVGLVGCYPSFPPASSSLNVRVEGSGLRLVWTPALVDADKTVASYRVDVDDTEVSLLDPSVNSCLLQGLASGTDHVVKVTAYDSAGRWSGNSALTASVTAPGDAPDGAMTSARQTPVVQCDVVDPPTPASVAVNVSQPTPGADTKLIGGQVAPVNYELTVTNTGTTASGEVVISDPLPAGTMLVAGSPSCGDAEQCSVTQPLDPFTGAQWTLTEVPPQSTSVLSFSVTVNPDLGTLAEITNSASFTNVATPGCDGDVCTTNSVSNPAEPWQWTRVQLDPYNVVFFNGVNTFNWGLIATNDPAATMSVDFTCRPAEYCQILSVDPVSKTVTFNFIWDDYDHLSFEMTVAPTATQGSRTMTYFGKYPFSLNQDTSGW